jgi:prepilin-type N-terminal cleavage/methylation domain-containing protein
MKWTNANKMRKQSKEEGFTLLEVIVAIAILTFGILAVATMQAAYIRGIFFSSTVTEGTTWAGDEVERLAALPWDDLLLQDTDGDGVPGLGDIGGNADNSNVHGRYTINWNVADNTPITNTKTINVIVTWTDRGAQKTVSLQRVVPRII